MKHFNSTIILCLLLVLGASINAEARLPKGLQRYQVGYSYPISISNYKISLADTVIERTVKTKGGFGVTMGTYIPVAKFSEASQLAFSIDGLFNMLIWDMEPVNDVYYSGTSGYNKEYVITGGSMQIGVPLGLDLKFGCDAALEKSKGAGFTFGAGVMPTAALTAYEGEAGAVIRAQPYLKGELAVFAGICFKLRAVYAMGKFDYINATGEKSGYDDGEGVTLTNKSTLTLSLILMPFSWAWDKVKY